MVYGRLRLFGNLQLTPGPDPHSTPIHVPAPHIQNLLAYLVLHAGRPIDRQKLAYLLWSESTDSAARRSLRQHLHRLRRLLSSLNLPDTGLTSHGNQLRFYPQPGLWIDIHAFQQQINNRQRQIEAIELYLADLLTENRSSWLQPFRVRLREQFMEAVRLQITWAKMQRNYPRVLVYADRLLQANPLRESSHRIYMEALYLNGKRIQALQQFAHLEALLAKELNTEPMPQTRDLLQRIKDGSLPRDLPIAVAHTRHVQQTLESSVIINDTFVGRRQELAQLDEALSQAFGQRGKIVLIAGESGLGKTRLLHTWQQMRASHMLTFRAECEPTGTPSSTHCLITALRSGFEQINWRMFPAQLPWVPTIQQFLANDSAARSPVSSHMLRQFMMTLITHAGQVTCLLLDDLHDADEATWNILAFLGRRCHQMPLLIVGTYEPHKLPKAAGQLMRSLKRSHPVEELTLWPLSPADTIRLAQILCPTSAIKLDLGQKIYRLTEGNPFFIGELLRSHGQQLSDQLMNEPADVHLPRTVQAAINGRIHPLPPNSRALLNIAAHIGRKFRFSQLVQAAPQCDDNELLDALDQWLAGSLIKERERGYEFTHEQIRRTALSMQTKPAA